MTTQPDDQQGGLTRRQIIAGAGAAAAGAAVLGTTLTAGTAGAKAPTGFAPRALDPAIAGLTYKAIDGVAFDVASINPAQRRIWQDITGAQPLNAPDSLYTSLELPVGAVIKQINAVYQGQPIVSIRERNFATGAITNVFTPTSMTASPGGAFASSTTVTPNVTIKPACTYQLVFFCSAGVSIMGATVGFTPYAFSPFAGAPAAARVLDTRLAGGKFSAGEERVLDLSGATPIGTAVVLNLTADQPEGTGFLSAYSGDISFPNTSALNYSTATPNIANTTTVVLGAGNKIKIRCGEASTHVIVDVVGYLL
jgi:hypothetical protein